MIGAVELNWTAASSTLFDNEHTSSEPCPAIPVHQLIREIMSLLAQVRTSESTASLYLPELTSSGVAVLESHALVLPTTIATLDTI